jgi:hypothetical protein
MSVPAWLLDIFAAVMLVVAAVSAARLVIAWRAGRRSDPDADIDVSHLLMGLAMAGTLAASLSTLPSGAWEVIFGALTAWFAYRVAREYRGRGLRALVSEHHAPHLLHSAAMLYMFLALRTSASHAGAPALPAMPGMSAAGLRLPTLALLFAFLLCAYVVADLDRVPAPPALARLHLATPSAPASSMALAGAPASAAFSAPADASASAVLTAPAALTAPADAQAPPAPASPPTTQAPTPPASPAAATPPASPAAATTPASPAPVAPVLAGLLSPGVARGCRIAMGVTMAFMLIIMI